MKFVIIGCGWLGSLLAEHLLERGHEVYASKRTQEKLSSLPLGVKGFVCNLNNPADEALLLPILDSAVVICAITPSRADENQCYVSSLQQLALLLSKAKARQVIHFSSTGVYQSLSGEVNEQSALNMNNDRVALLAAGEKALRQFDATITFRLAGLMGPNRHPGRFMLGKTLPNAKGAINMVHSSDIIKACMLVCDKNVIKGVFNLCCPSFTTRESFYQKAASLLNLPPPVFDADVSLKHHVKSEYFIEQHQFSYQFPSAIDALVYC